MTEQLTKQQLCEWIAAWMKVYAISLTHENTVQLVETMTLQLAQRMSALELDEWKRKLEKRGDA